MRWVISLNLLVDKIIINLNFDTKVAKVKRFKIIFNTILNRTLNIQLHNMSINKQKNL